MHLRTALDSIRRSPFQAASAVFVLSLTFFVATLLTVVVYSSNQVVSYFETRPQVIAFLTDEATAEEVADLQNTLTNDTRVQEVEYVSKEQALEIYKQATSDNPLLSELVSPTIFPASLEFSLRDLSTAQAVIDEVRAVEIVDQVGFTASLGGESTLGDVVNRLRTITSYVRIGGGIFAAILFATSFMVLLIIIGMRMTTRRGEIEILDLIGATPAFIKSPIVLEALIYSVVGVLVGWTTIFLMTLYSAPEIIRYFGEIPVLPRQTTEIFILFGAILLGELLIGSLLAFTGSQIAVNRARRGK